MYAMQRLRPAVLQRAGRPCTVSRASVGGTNLENVTGGEGDSPPVAAGALTFDQAHFARARPLARILRRELHPLTFPQQLEYRTADGASMEEVLDSTLIPD